MFKLKDKNGVEALLPRYVAKCTTVGSGNIFVGKAKNRFVKQADGSFVGLASGKDKDETIHVSDMPFGEAIQLVSTAGNTVAVTVEGKDYLGQKMVEQITLNGAIVSIPEHCLGDYGIDLNHIPVVDEDGLTAGDRKMAIEQGAC